MFAVGNEVEKKQEHQRVGPPKCFLKGEERPLAETVRDEIRAAGAQWVAPGSRAWRCAARQSVGTTSKPTPGSRLMPAACASAERRASASKTAISPVMSR